MRSIYKNLYLCDCSQFSDYKTAVSVRVKQRDYKVPSSFKKSRAVVRSGNDAKFYIFQRLECEKCLRKWLEEQTSVSIRADFNPQTLKETGQLMSNHLWVNISTTDHTISKLFINIDLNKHLFKHRRWLNLDSIESQIEHRYELVSSIGNEILSRLLSHRTLVDIGGSYSGRTSAIHRWCKAKRTPY